MKLPAVERAPIADLIGFTDTIHVADIGAAFIAEVPLYKSLLDNGIAHLHAFDADTRQHPAIKQAFGARVNVHPQIVGDGTPARLHLASAASGMSSLLAPAAENLAFFNGFKEFGEIHETLDVATVRLDDIAGLPPIDFIKMDIQGSELAVLRSGPQKLARCVAIQLEISFVPLYERQPCFGEIDVWMRANGFVPHTMVDLKCWSISPLIRDGNFRVPFNQLLEGDIVYLRDCISTQSLTDLQIKKMILIAEACYGSPDLVIHLLGKLIARGAISEKVREEYVQRLAGSTGVNFSFFS